MDYQQQNNESPQEDNMSTDVKHSAPIQEGEIFLQKEIKVGHEVFSLLQYADSSKVLIGCDDGYLRGYETTGKFTKLCELKVHENSYTILDLKIVQHSKIQQNRKILITCGADCRIKIFHFNPENIEHPIDEQDPITILNTRRSVRALLVFPDQQRLVSGGGDSFSDSPELKIWNLDKMLHIKDFGVINGNGNIGRLCHLSNGRFAAATWVGHLYFFENFVKSSEIMKAHDTSILTLCHSAKNKVMISGSWDKSVKIWNYLKSPPECLKLIKCGSIVWSISLVLDEKVLMSAECDYSTKQGLLRFWDLKSYKELFQKEVPGQPIGSVFSNKKDQLIIANGKPNQNLYFYTLINQIRRKRFGYLHIMVEAGIQRMVGMNSCQEIAELFN